MYKEECGIWTWTHGWKARAFRIVVLIYFDTQKLHSELATARSKHSLRSILAVLEAPPGLLFISFIVSEY